MFLRSKTRIKDGKQHRYLTVVESRRLPIGEVAQRQVYTWRNQTTVASGMARTMEVFAERKQAVDAAESFRRTGRFP